MQTSSFVQWGYNWLRIVHYARKLLFQNVLIKKIKISSKHIGKQRNLTRISSDINLWNVVGALFRPNGK